nr:MAG TPA_asm: hypothetical protein [Caudoviricetes sp.]
MHGMQQRMIVLFTSTAGVKKRNRTVLTQR